jgi:hypothetical protein
MGAHAMAGFTGDILAILDKVPVWKRVQAAPDRIDALEKRIAELEARLTRAPGQACPSCGALEFRVTTSVPSKGPFGRLGAKDVTRGCGACSFTETDLVTPK